jgi:hypothetical protein
MAIRKGWFSYHHDYEGLAWVGCLFGGIFWLFIIILYPIKQVEVDSTQKKIIVQYEGEKYQINEEDLKHLHKVKDENFKLVHEKTYTFFGVEILSSPKIKINQ